MREWCALLLSGFLLIQSIVADAQQRELLDMAFESYWNTNSAKETEVAIGKILQMNPSFEEVYARLKTGRAYSPDVTRGFFDWYSVAPPNIELHCLVFVPKDYRPDKKYPARVFLHGAVSNMDPTYVRTIIDQKDPSYDTLQQIVIYPSGYYFATWWTDRQYDHVMQTLRKLKKLYNIDENRIRIGGISDGGTGTYAFANFNPTPWSCYTPYIGSAAVLDQVSRKQVYLGNFSVKPFFIVNTGHDNIFEPGTVMPYVNEILKVNTRSTFIFVDSSGHDLNWLPSLRDTITRFISDHPRKPFPDTLYWQTENMDRYNRNHWVIVNRIAKTKENGIVDDPNNIFVDGASKRAFHRDTISGIISVIRSGNEIRVSSKNIKEYTLLLSPEQFDFTMPVKVITNGELSYHAVIEKKIDVLLNWFSQDEDRTMLFGSSLKIEVGKKWKE